MCKIACLVIVFFSGGLKESIAEEKNATLSLNSLLKLQNDTNPSSVAINVKEAKTGRRDLTHLDDKVSTSSKQLAFLDFLKEAVTVLISYDDQDLEDIFAVIDDEVRKYRYNGRGIKTWARSSDTLKRILKQLEIMKEMSSSNLRRNLNQLNETLQKNSFGENVTQLIDFIDSLYHNDTAFLSVINDINQFKYKFKRSNIYLSDLVKKSLQSLIFDPYKNMGLKKKDALNLKMDIFMKKLPAKDHREYHVQDIIRTNKHELEKDESATNLELQFMPQLKVREIQTEVDGLKKNQYREKSTWKTKSITRITKTTTSKISSEINNDDQHPQNEPLKRNLKQRVSNINIKTSDIGKNQELLNFILSLIGSIGDKRTVTSTTESNSQADMLMTFIKSLIKSFPSKTSESDGEDRTSNPKSRSKNIYFSHDSKHKRSQHKPFLNIEFVGLSNKKGKITRNHQD